MEIAYLMAGKRFKVFDEQDLDRVLSQYNLITNLSNGGDWSVRRLTDDIGMSRYDMVQAVGDSVDVDGYDVCIGKLIGKNNRVEVIETELSALEVALQEIKQDIPDAKILAGSYWS